MIVKIVFEPKIKTAIPFIDRFECDNARQIPVSKEDRDEDKNGYYLKLFKKNNLIKTIRIYRECTTVYFLENGKTTDTIRTI